MTTPSPIKKLPLFGDFSHLLIEDKSGELYQRITKRIAAKIREKEVVMEKGVSVEKKLWMEKELGALQSANRIVDLFWHSAHHQPE